MSQIANLKARDVSLCSSPSTHRISSNTGPGPAELDPGASSRSKAARHSSTPVVGGIVAGGMLVAGGLGGGRGRSVGVLRDRRSGGTRQ